MLTPAKRTETRERLLGPSHCSEDSPAATPARANALVERHLQIRACRHLGRHERLQRLAHCLRGLRHPELAKAPVL
jgi:hypothetical protein